MYLNNAPNTVVTDNNVTLGVNCWSWTFGIRADGDDSNSLIQYNRFSTPMWGGGAGISTPGGHVTISNNYVTGYAGIAPGGHSQVLYNNVTSTWIDVGWDFAPGNNIIGNNFIHSGGSSWSAAVYVNGDSNVTNNTITGPGSTRGINIEGSNNQIQGNTITGFDTGINEDGNQGGNNNIWQNNIYSNGVGVRFAHYDYNFGGGWINDPIELSVDGKGNYWGRTSAPYMIPGVDTSSIDEVDSYPYAQQDAWNTGGQPTVTANTQCGETITSSRTMSGGLNCPTSGIVIGADGITLDCAGHEINYANSGYGEGIHAEGRTGITIKNCKVFENRYVGYTGSIPIHFIRTSNSLIQNNTVYSGWWGYTTAAAITLDSTCANNRITGNDITGLDSYCGGINIDWFSNADNNTIDNNSIRTTVRHAILCGGSNNIIANNSIFAKWNDIYFHAGNNTIVGNNIVLNPMWSNSFAVRLVNYENFTGNNVTLTSPNGGSKAILMDGSMYSIVKDNILQGFDYGLAIGGNGFAGYNNISNNLINSTSGVLFSGTVFTNNWNDSKDGNYWADPSGTGFSQDPATCRDANHNGICDLPYTLSATGPNVDYLPLATMRTGAPPENMIYNSTGGTVEDQSITVTIPPGSLGTTELLVDIVPSTHSFAPTVGITNVSPLLDIGPQCADIGDESTCGETNGCRWNELAMCESIPFLSPVTITMPGDCTGTYGDLITQKIAKYNIISGTPEPVSTCDPEDIGGGMYSCQEMDGRTMTWDTNTCTISVQTWSFSTYGVILFLDEDNDGVWDIKDDCPNDAGVKGFNGCTAALSIKAENHTKVTVGKKTTSVKFPLVGLQVEVYDKQCVTNAGLTPAAKDFDKIRAACPAVVNKTTDSAGSVFMGVNANKAYVVIGVLNGKTNSQLGTPTDTIFEGQILEKKLQYLTVPDITKMPPLSFLFDAIDQGNFLVFVITIAVALAIGYLFGRGMTKTRTITREKKRRRR
jgi:hypothetical protein